MNFSHLSRHNTGPLFQVNRSYDPYMLQPAKRYCEKKKDFLLQMGRLCFRFSILFYQSVDVSISGF